MSVERELLSGIHALKTSGYNINAEHQVLISNRNVYYSTNLFFQATNTVRNGEYDRSTFTIVRENRYNVRRYVYAIMSKFGVQLDFGSTWAIPYTYEPACLGNIYVNVGFHVN
jgi:hypothetical protein